MLCLNDYSSGKEERKVDGLLSGGCTERSVKDFRCSSRKRHIISSPLHFWYTDTMQKAMHYCMMVEHQFESNVASSEESDTIVTVGGESIPHMCACSVIYGTDVSQPGSITAVWAVSRLTRIEG